jgi:hypothetical protein
MDDDVMRPDSLFAVGNDEFLLPLPRKKALQTSSELACLWRHTQLINKPSI